VPAAEPADCRKRPGLSADRHTEWFRGRITMPTYIVLTHFTEQGIRNVKDTTKRADALHNMAKNVGGTVKETYWTIGRYDSVAIVEAPNDEAIVTLGLSIGKQGNVRTETLRAFSKAEVEGILAKVP
jgi:uncharacterized protein with GYD domain